MTIRAAYDISFIAGFVNRFDRSNGICRVIEENLRAMSRRTDVEVTAMSLCSRSAGGAAAAAENPLFSSVYSYLYLKSHGEPLICKFDPAFKSRLGLAKLYRSVFHTSLSKEFQAQPRFSPRSLYFRGASSLLYRLADTYRVDKIERLFAREKFDVFHSTYLKLPGAELTAGVPRILTVYDLIPIQNPEFVEAGLPDFFREILASVDVERDWAACISEYTKQEFCDYTGMAAERVFVTPLAAADHFRPVRDPGRIAEVRQRYRIPEGEYFLSIATPQPRKNLAHLIRSFYELLAAHPALAVNLVLVGSTRQGWMYDEIFAAMNNSSEFRPRIVFTDYIPDEDLSAVYSGARAFVFPSLSEGFGLPPLEAMQCGVPVISSNTTSLPEVIGDAGIMVDPKDSAALSQAMLDLATNKALCDHYSRKGVARAARYTWEECAAATIGGYKKAVEYGRA